MNPTEAKQAQQALLALGFIGGIIAVVSVFLPWAVYFSGATSGTISGWDCATSPIWSISSAPYLPLIGGILAVVGAIGILGAKVKAIGYLLPIGGILAIVGAVWGLSSIGAWTWAGVASSYGIIVSQFGGGLAILGSFGLVERWFVGK